MKKLLVESKAKETIMSFSKCKKSFLNASVFVFSTYYIKHYLEKVICISLLFVKGHFPKIYLQKLTFILDWVLNFGDFTKFDTL